MMWCMTLARCGAYVSRTIPCLVLVACFSLQPAPAGRWDAQGAALAFEEAGQKRSGIAQAKQPDLNQYLECARTYRNVYLKDPHYRHAADAIYQEALLYQEMGDKFADLKYYQTAAKRFHLLVTDYGGHPNCPDALLRLGAIYSQHLKDENAGREAYRCLRTQYKDSRAAIQRARAEISQESAQAQATPPAPPRVEDKTPSLASVQSIRHWSTKDYTRVIIDLDRYTRYETSRLSDPDRIYFDISNAKLSSDLLNRTIAIGDELLKQVRIAQYRSDTVRVVLDVSAAGEDSVSELHDPFRIVIDLRPQAALKQAAAASQAVQKTPEPAIRPNASPSAFSPEPPMAVTEIGSPAPKEIKPAPPPLSASVSKAQPALEGRAVPPRPDETQAGTSAPKAVKPVPTPAPGGTVKGENKKADSVISPAATPQAAAPTSHGDRTLTRILGLKIGRIVLDPGHGGHDLGTRGPGGLLEKNLVLSLALDLQKLLQENLGAEVVLTRNDDTFIPLEERTEIANQHRADLFISIHANSSRVRSISGVETYYLDFAKTESEREVAARENASTDNNVRDLEGLIKKIAQADKSAESRELAAMVQKKLYSGARKLSPSAQDRGVRTAPFVVLIGANMPSVLAEVAFISNPKDERILNKAANQELLAKALYSGIESYMRTLGSRVVHNETSPK